MLELITLYQLHFYGTKWVNKPSKEVLATSARMHQKICVIIICATKPCQPVACSQKAFP